MTALPDYSYRSLNLNYFAFLIIRIFGNKEINSARAVLTIDLSVPSLPDILAFEHELSPAAEDPHLEDVDIIIGRTKSIVEPVAVRRE